MSLPFDAFEKAIDLNNLISHILSQTNFHASQNGRNFGRKDVKMKAVLEMKV